MKISPSSPYAHAALELAQATLERRAEDTAFLFKVPASDLAYDLHKKGTVAISSPPPEKGKLTLSARAHFARPAVVNVQAVEGKVRVGVKAFDFSLKSRESEACRVLASADPKASR